MEPAPADPLTAILVPAVKGLNCVQSDEDAVEKSLELNPGPSSPGEPGSRKSQNPLKQPAIQAMVPPPSVPESTHKRREECAPGHVVAEEPTSIAAGFSGRQTSIEIRTYQFKDALSKDLVELNRLRALAYHGVPDREALRATAWKLLLNYLPPEKQQWRRVLAEKRAAYGVFCKELIVDPKMASKQNDHPLSQNNDSQWAAFFKDAEIMEQIDRDVMRTHPDMHFFSGSDRSAELHREEMKRALFVFAKLNPGLRYVQGMNELFAPLYYQFRNDVDVEARGHAEADAFYCFIDIIAEFRDHFCQQLDNSRVGIRATLTKLSDLLQEKDPQLWSHVQVTNKVNPQFYAFRWVTLLLTQEFSFPDSVRLWDTLFSDKGGRFDCLLRLCCAMLINVREELLKGDFAQNLKLLQRYPPVDVHAILHKAASL